MCSDSGYKATDGMCKDSLRGELAVTESIEHSGVGAEVTTPAHTDRNRTSPFAFTGNKFEFRAPGSSQSCSEPNVVLNTIVAEAFDMIAEQLEKLDDKNFHTGLQKILQKIVKEHKRVLYNGNGYTDEWVKEAERRGLPNIRTSLEALKALTKDENVELFEKSA